jgi:hypothetical protein
MPRNLFERCEVVFPVRDPAAKARIHDEILPAYLADTVKARLQQPDGTYLDGNQLRLGKNLLDRNVAGKHTNVGNANLAGSDARPLFLDRADAPLLRTQVKPDEDRHLHHIVIVFAHVPILKHPIDVIDVGFIGSSQIGFK